MAAYVTSCVGLVLLAERSCRLLPGHEAAPPGVKRAVQMPHLPPDSASSVGSKIGNVRHGEAEPASEVRLGLLKLREEWLAEERTSAKYIRSKRYGEGELTILLPAVSRERIDRLREGIVAVLRSSVSAKGQAADESQLQREADLELQWYRVKEHPRAVVVSAHQLDVPPSGLLMVLVDAAAVKDRVQFVDYGKVLESEDLPAEAMGLRFGHLYETDIRE